MDIIAEVHKGKTVREIVALRTSTNNEQSDNKQTDQSTEVSKVNESEFRKAVDKEMMNYIKTDEGKND